MDNEAKILWPWLRIGYRIKQARVIREELRLYAARLRAEGHWTANATSAENLNRKRYARRKFQKKRKQYLKGRTVIWTTDVLAKANLVPETILDGLFPQRHSKWISPFERKLQRGELDLENFSLIDDPVHAMQLLAHIAQLEAFITHGRLNFDDSACLDVGPFLILQEMHRGMCPIYRGGRISNSVKEVLEHLNLRKSLGMNFRQGANEARLWPLPVRTRSAQGRTAERLLTEQTSEQVASDVIEKINGWLSMLADFELSPEGERSILKFIGEGLDNAERHSSPGDIEGVWSVAGFMTEVASASGTQYRCHMALLSKGQTIAESMATAKESTLRELGYYVKRHAPRIGRPGFNSENLTTVYALQDGVSRVEKALALGRGGTGFMDLLSFFASLGATANPDWMPKFSIVSGHTCVRIMAPYTEGRRMSPGPSAEGLLPPRELWFNAANSPSAAPDPNHVLNLPAKLQGTLITIAWTIDKDFLEKTAGHGT